MPCTCGHSGTTTLTVQGSRRHVPDIDSLRKMSTRTSRKCCYQLPGPACQQSTVRAGYRSASGKHTETLTLCRAQKQDEKEKDMVGGFDVDSEPGFLESEAVGIVFKVQFAFSNTLNAHFDNCTWQDHQVACERQQQLNDVCCRLVLWRLCPLELQPYCCWRDQ